MISTIVGVLASLATIVGGLLYMLKFTSWALKKTPDQQNQNIDKQEQQNKAQAEETGRPV